MANQDFVLQTPSTQRTTQSHSVEKAIREMDMERRLRREGIKRQRIELVVIPDDESTSDDFGKENINISYRPSSLPAIDDLSFELDDSPMAIDDIIEPPNCTLRPRTLNSLFDKCMMPRPRSISFDNEELPYMPPL